MRSSSACAASGSGPLPVSVMRVASGAASRCRRSRRSPPLTHCSTRSVPASPASSSACARSGPCRASQRCSAPPSGASTRAAPSPTGSGSSSRAAALPPSSVAVAASNQSSASASSSSSSAGTQAPARESLGFTPSRPYSSWAAVISAASSARLTSSVDSISRSAFSRTSNTDSCSIACTSSR